MSNPWGSKVGSWAAEAEADEENENNRMDFGGGFPSLSKPDDEAFPTLGAAASMKKEKKKKEKKTLTLQQFALGATVSPASSGLLSTGDRLTVQEQIILPKGPRERDESETGPTLGGGFRRYGMQSSYPGSRERDGGYSRDSEGGFGKDRERGGLGRGRDREREREPEGPSRADESSSWITEKKVAPSYDRYGGKEKYFEGFTERKAPERDGPSRADEVDRWSSSKQYVPSSGFGADRGQPRRTSDPVSRADEMESWTTAKSYVPASSSRSFDSLRDSGDSGRWGRREATKDSFPERSAPSERPKLQLQKRTTPIETAPSGAGPGGEKPTLTVEESAPAPKPKSDPFGGARPREEVLAAKSGLEVKKSDSESKSGGSTSSSRHNSRPQTPDSPVPPSLTAKPIAAPEPQAATQAQKNWRTIAKKLESRPSERPQTEEEKKLAGEIESLSLLLERAGLRKSTADKSKEALPQNGSLSVEAKDEEDGLQAEAEEAIEEMNAKLERLKNELKAKKEELDEKYKSQSSVEVERWERSEPATRGGDMRQSFERGKGESLPERSKWGDANRWGDGARRRESMEDRGSMGSRW